MLTNNIDKLDVGTGQYTFLLNERGGIIDDLIVYRIGEQKFLLVVNAARTDEDFAWLQSAIFRLQTHVRSRQIAARILAESPSKGRAIADCFTPFRQRYRSAAAKSRLSIFHSDGTTVSVARTGYTGEDGIEVFFRATDAVKFWNAVLEKGKAVRD